VVLVLMHDDLRLCRSTSSYPSAAHVFDQDAQVQAGRVPETLNASLFSVSETFRGDIAFELFHEPFGDCCGWWTKLAFFAAEGESFTLKHHGECWRLDVGGLERLGVDGIAERVADVDRFKVR